MLWLPALSRAGGYRGGHAGDEPLHLDLARDGFAVACHDPLGAGSRLAEGARFAARHPRWSPLGRMVADAQAVVEAAGALPGVDGRRVLLAGYGTGALVAAHVLALCPAVTAAALVAPSGSEPLLPCGFTAPPAARRPPATAAGRRVLVLSPRVGFDLRAVEAAARRPASSTRRSTTTTASPPRRAGASGSGWGRGRGPGAPRRLTPRG